ncbi:MAG: hypothetical protein IT249_06665 [Chitinophagaceae bacterium]|nr:hypothetical protein [Chitinophagaceae bacterium]
MIKLLAFFCMMVSFTHAQTVDEIQQKYITALGGKSKLSSLKNIYQEADMEVMGMTMPAKTWIIYGTAMRQEIEIQGQKIATFVGKNGGWTVNPMMGSTEPQPLPEDAIKGYMGMLEPGGELSSFKEKGYTATFEGKEAVNANDAYKIKLVKDSSETILYIDEKTNYLTKSITKANAGGQTIEVTTLFSNYKTSPEGYTFPYSLTINNPMIGEIKSTVTKFDINKPVDVAELEKKN